MPRWTRLEENVGVELTTDDPTGRFHPDIVWISVPDDFQIGDVFDGQAFNRPPAPSLPIPIQVSKVQAKIALRRIASSTNLGKTLLDDVEAAVSNSGNPDLVIAWQDSTIVERRGLFVLLLAPHIVGLDSDAALDALFRNASLIAT